MEQGKASIQRDCARVEPQHEISQLAPCCLLTVKLRGRTTTPDRRRGRTLSPGARGAKQTTPHGPLQRLLDGRRATPRETPSIEAPKNNAERRKQQGSEQGQPC